MTDHFQSTVAPQHTHAEPAKRRRRVPVDTLPSTEKVSLLESAEEIRQTLRNSLVQVNDLIHEIKAQRQQDRLLRNTMDSLRKLSLA